MTESKMPEWIKNAATIMAAIGLGGTGAVGGLQSLDLFGVTQLESHLASCQEDNEQDVLRADVRLSEMTQACSVQVMSLVGSVNSLRGQNCEMQRASGAIRVDANCWGREVR